MWFKKKKQIEREVPIELPILIEYIKEARRLGIKDKSIIKKFKEKNYPENLIEIAFYEVDKLITFKQFERRNTMSNKKEYEDEDEDFEDEDEDFEDEEEVPKKKVKKETRRRPSKERKSNLKSDDSVKELDNTLDSVLSNHEQRIQNLEAALFRMKGSI